MKFNDWTKQGNVRIIKARSLTSTDACWEVTGCDASCQEVGRCSTRGGSQGMYYIHLHKKANKAEPTLALKPRGDLTRNPKQWYQWPQKRTCVRSIDPAWSGGGPRNMKYKGPPMAAIFFMTSFNRDRGGHDPLAPPRGSAAGPPKTLKMRTKGEVLEL